MRLMLSGNLDKFTAAVQVRQCDVDESIVQRNLPVGCHDEDILVDGQVLAVAATDV